MNLSNHDLRQIDESYLDSLSEVELREVSKKLCRDLKAARERLNQNPDNSSRPPSSRAPWEQAKSEQVAENDGADNGDKKNQKKASTPSTKADKDTASNPDSNKQNEKPSNTPGKQKGAPGYGRKLELAVTDEKPHKPECCAACSKAFGADTNFTAWTGRYELELELGESDLAGIHVKHLKHTYYQAICQCGHTSRTEPGHAEIGADWSVDVTEWHLCGPNLVSLIVCLSQDLHVSRDKIRGFLSDWLHIELSKGVINTCIHEAAHAAEPVVREQLIPQLLESKLLHIDETPWKQVKQMLWLWVFVSTTTVVLGIGKRDRTMLLKMLGEKFAGVLMSDGFGVYRSYDNRIRCWAHLIRKARGLAQSLDSEAQSFGESVLMAMYLLMRNIYRLRDGPPDEEAETIGQHNVVLRNMLRDLCELFRENTYEAAQSLAREFLYDWEAIIRVIEEPALPLTNNTAECALRPWVILRKITFGSRNHQGSQVVALLASIIATCRLRSLNLWRYLAEVIELRRKGLPAPVMPLVVM